MIRIVFAILVSLSLVLIVVGTAQAEESVVDIYQVWSQGGNIVWWNAPLANNYRCTLYIENVLTGESHWVVTTFYTIPDPKLLLFHYYFDFRGGVYRIVGDINEVNTSACEAWTDEWGDAVLLKTSYIIDLRNNIYLPMIFCR
jgi:hypothetical protein